MFLWKQLNKAGLKKIICWCIFFCLFQLVIQLQKFHYCFYNECIFFHLGHFLTMWKFCLTFCFRQFENFREIINIKKNAKDDSFLILSLFLFSSGPHKDVQVSRDSVAL